MKFLVLLSLVLSASFAEARQYIQCSDVDSNSHDRSVINLDGEKSTLFQTTGLDDPKEMRILKNIKLISADAQYTVYQSRDELSIETVTIPTEFIGKASNKVTANLDLQAVDGSLRYSIDLICFSAIYLP